MKDVLLLIPVVCFLPIYLGEVFCAASDLPSSTSVWSAWIEPFLGFDEDSQTWGALILFAVFEFAFMQA